MSSNANSNNSPRKAFLELLAPRWRVPPCPFGNKHHAGLCMGTAVPDNIGRRSFYCKPGRGKMVCPDEDRMSPILAEAERSQLLKALQTFTKAMSSRCGIERLVAQNADAPLEVEIYVYLEVFDTYIKQKGSVKNGTYSFLLDSALCSLLNFPTSS
ncbi:hypothetical protein GALMADRAFT_217690, partial [Galerina marginata CBS 339.88]